MELRRNIIQLRRDMMNNTNVAHNLLNEEVERKIVKATKDMDLGYYEIKISIQHRMPSICEFNRRGW